MDKIAKIKAEIERMNKEAYGREYGWAVKCETLCRIQSYINSLPEEPVSEELEEEIKRMIYDSYYDVAGIAIKGTSLYLKVDGLATIARHFAQWQKQKTISKACEAFCKAECDGHPPRSTCTSLGTCKKYDDFCKALRED